jgi:dTDP-4-amino-4,6-dideoxygalactose transaminase
MAAPKIPLFKVFMADGAHAALLPVLQSGQLGAGRLVATFETGLAAWMGAPDAVALSDASAALTLALTLAGVGPSDEVITSPLACSATVMPIANLFAKPVWCDVEPDTGMPNPTHIAARMTERTRAVLLYSWAGDVPDLDGIAALCAARNIPLIHDGSEGLGARWKDSHLGGHADFTVYSFYATKHLTTGEGAALLARKPLHLQQARQLRRFGIDPATFRLGNGDLNPAFNIVQAGYNFPMNEIAATLGNVQLAQVDALLQKYQDNGQYYEKALQGIAGLKLHRRHAHSRSAYWTYSLCAERRDELIRKLAACGIGSQRLHLRNDQHSCFEPAPSGGLHGVAQFDAENLSIPCGWWVGEAERERIARTLRNGW